MASTTTSPKVWFITGCSSGFGAALALEALSRGDEVIATARNIDQLEEAKKAGADILQFDVTAPLEELHKKAQQAYDMHGRIDYLINNAGYALQGTVEELTPAESQAQFDTNVFGVLNVTRAFLPFMRAARSGVIANFGSIAGWVGYPSFGLYCGSKAAVIGISESIAQEVAGFGIRVCSVEPGYFRSSFLKPGNRIKDEGRISDYDGTVSRKVAAMMDEADSQQPGDPKKGAKVLVDVLSGKTGKDIPLRLPLGSDAYAYIKQKCEDTLALLEEWKDLSVSTDYDNVTK